MDYYSEEQEAKDFFDKFDRAIMADRGVEERRKLYKDTCSCLQLYEDVPDPAMLLLETLPLTLTEANEFIVSYILGVEYE